MPLFQNMTRPFYLDGATGTRLQALGLPSGAFTPQWSLEHPEAIRSVQRSYAEAGSDAVYASTFGLTRVGLEQHGLRGDLREMNLRLVELSRDAAPGLLVAGDICVTGLPLPPMGDTAFETLVSIFTEQAAALEEAGVDFFTIETQLSLMETRAAFLAVRAVSAKPVLVSFAMNDGGYSFYGGDMCALLVTMQDMGAAAFGINCCGDMEQVRRQLERMRPLAAVPLVAKPNAGKPVQEEGKNVYRLSPDELAHAGEGFVEAGAALLGGCCGTDERHIAALRAATERLRPVSPNPLPTDIAASEYLTARLTNDSRVAELPVTENIADDAADARDEGAELLLLEIGDEPQLEAVLSNQSALKLPLCIRCGDEKLRARFHREYNGKALYLGEN